MKYYIIAGEASGDLHGSNLVRALKNKDAKAEVRAWGGDEMQAAGADLVVHYKDIAFMGFVEVAKNLPTVLKNIKFCKQDIQGFQPDVVILIDYPGFNLKMADFAKSIGIKTVYYISPKVWAWKASRIPKIKATVDRMLTIFPFETAFYAQHDYQVHYVGNPLNDSIQRFKESPKALSLPKDDRPIIALLPGSRKQELKSMFPVFLKVANQLKQYRFVVAGMQHLGAAFYNQFKQYGDFEIVWNETYALLNEAKAGIITSGTASLETAMFNVPQVVCYKGNPVSIFIGRLLVKLKYFSLPNLVMDAPIIKELLQKELTVQNISAELNKILEGEERTQMLKDYQELQTALGGPGVSKRAADVILDLIQ